MGAAVALVVLVPVVASILVSVVLTRRVLAGRLKSMVLPADEFDPSVEDVERLALSVNRLQRIVGRRLDQRGRALRIELSALGDGAMAYSVEGPEDRSAVLQAAMYGGVEMRDPEWLDVPGLGAQGQGVRPVGRMS